MLVRLSRASLAGVLLLVHASLSKSRETCDAEEDVTALLQHRTATVSQGAHRVATRHSLWETVGEVREEEATQRKVEKKRKKKHRGWRHWWHTRQMAKAPNSDKPQADTASFTQTGMHRDPARRKAWSSLDNHMWHRNKSWWQDVWYSMGHMKSCGQILLEGAPPEQSECRGVFTLMEDVHVNGNEVYTKRNGPDWLPSSFQRFLYWTPENGGQWQCDDDMDPSTTSRCTLPSAEKKPASSSSARCLAVKPNGPPWHEQQHLSLSCVGNLEAAEKEHESHMKLGGWWKGKPIKAGCHEVTFSGAPKEKAWCNGVYTITDLMVHSHPVYAKDESVASLSGNAGVASTPKRYLYWNWHGDHGGQWQCDDNFDPTDGSECQTPSPKGWFVQDIASRCLVNKRSVEKSISVQCTQSEFAHEQKHSWTKSFADWTHHLWSGMHKWAKSGYDKIRDAIVV